MSSLFVDRENDHLNKDYFQSLFETRFSDNPQTKVKEKAAYVYFMDFIEECEDCIAMTEDERKVTLGDLLIFFSGAEREPPLGFSPKPHLLFSDDLLASASTCSLRLTLPTQHSTYESFKEYMILSLIGNDGFGRT